MILSQDIEKGYFKLKPIEGAYKLDFPRVKLSGLKFDILKCFLNFNLDRGIL